MTILPGEIHALAGQNGAGKSTLIRVLAGVEDADRGRVIFRGKSVRPRTAKLPFNFIHQDFGLVEATVAENRPRRGLPAPRRLIAWVRSCRLVKRCARSAATSIRGRSAASRPARRAGGGDDGRVVVLDEPTALTGHEVDMLWPLPRLRGRGVAMLYVTHRLDEVLDRGSGTLFRDGRGDDGPDRRCHSPVWSKRSQGVRSALLPRSRPLWGRGGAGSRGRPSRIRPGFVRAAARRSACPGGSARRRPRLIGRGLFGAGRSTPGLSEGRPGRSSGVGSVRHGIGFVSGARGGRVGGT